MTKPNTPTTRKPITITVKNVKVHEGLSEETLAYTATLYINGQRAAKASNRGHGGPDMYHPTGNTRDLIQRAEDAAATHTFEYLGKTFNKSLESFVGTVVSNTQEQKRIKRMLKTKVLWLDGDGELWVMSMGGHPRAKVIAFLKEKDGLDDDVFVTLETLEKHYPTTVTI